MNTHIHRRRFLSTVACSSFAAAVASGDYAPIPRSGKARFTPTLNAYSFVEQLNANLVDSTSGMPTSL